MAKGIVGYGWGVWKAVLDRLMVGIIWGNYCM